MSLNNKKSNGTTDLTTRTSTTADAAQNAQITSEIVGDTTPDDNTVTDFVDASQKIVTPAFQRHVAVCKTGFAKQDMHEVLTRPFPIAEFTWSSTQEVGIPIEVLLPYHLLVAKPAISKKLTNFQFLRAGMRIEVRINATSFHYGSLMVAWIPYYMELQKSAKYTNLRGLSGFKYSTVISAGTSETKGFDIPFASPSERLPLDTVTLKYYGALVISILNPLSCNTSPVPPVQCQVWASFIEPEWSGPCLTMNVPFLTAEDFDDAEAYMRDAVTLQVGDNPEADAKSAAGILSGVASFIPTALSYAQPILEGIGPIVKAFTADYPTSVATDTSVIPRYPNMATTEGLNPAYSLAPRGSAYTPPCLDHMGDDENTFNHDLVTLAKKFTLLDSITWKSSDLRNKVIYSQANNPLKWPQSFAGHIAKCSAAWRGSTRYIIQIVSSAFHSGRLRVVYNPYAEGDPIGESSTDIYNTPGTLIDIRSASEFPISFPYINRYQWCVYNDSQALTSGNGRIYLVVENQLTSSISPVTDIYINVWCAMDDDFQLGYPTAAYLPLIPKYVPQVDDDERAKVELQIGTHADREALKFDSSMPVYRYKDTSTCFINGPTTIDHFIKRYTLAYSSINNRNVYIEPYVAFYRHVMGDVLYKSFREHFAQIFRFYRGSFRFIVDGKGEGSLGAAMTYFTYSDQARYFDTVGQPQHYAYDGFQMARSGQNLAFEMPWCLDQNCVLTDWAPVAVGTYSPNVLPALYVGVWGYNNTYVQVYEAAGDDFVFGSLMGVPLNYHTDGDENDPLSKSFDELIRQKAQESSTRANAELIKSSGFNYRRGCPLP